MGLERLLMVLQGVSCIYETDLWRGWQRTVQGFGLPERSQRLLCDHLRSLVVLSGDGVFPSNSGRGYVPRRLLRRVLSEMWSVDERLTLEGIPEQPIYETLEHIGRPEVPIRQVTDMLESEERRFRSLLERARILVPRHLSGRRPSREDYLFLHDTHGLPRELVDRLLEETS
jgi:alanyl-tRNA synthetase